MYLICFRDEISGIFTAPVAVGSLPVFARQLRSILQRPADSATAPLWHQFPKDHAVYLCGRFDESTGRVDSCEPAFKYHLLDVMSGEECGKDVD